LLNAWYTYRTTNSQDYLESLYKQRDETIEKLKTATKYDSTQKLLEKYGGWSPVSAQKGQGKAANGKAKGQGKSPTTSPKQQKETRVFINPPPTANINRGPATPATPATPDTAASSAKVTEEFAPNAFDEVNPQPSPVAIAAPFKAQSQPQSPQPAYQESQVALRGSSGGWMDRLVSALMGEDETLPTNRLALLCASCRLVNGLAPPGVRTLEELGRWRCASCGAWNGVQAEVALVVPVPTASTEEAKDEVDESEAKEVKKSKGKGRGKKKAAKVQVQPDEEDEKANTEEEEDEEEDSEVITVKKSKGKTKGKKKAAKEKVKKEDEDDDDDESER
jgi:endoplasmic reticulum junction formation protein lunapark